MHVVLPWLPLARLDRRGASVLFCLGAGGGVCGVVGPVLVEGPCGLVGKERKQHTGASVWANIRQEGPYLASGIPGLPAVWAGHGPKRNSFAVCGLAQKEVPL